jgi:hypothetical protein
MFWRPGWPWHTFRCAQVTLLYAVPTARNQNVRSVQIGGYLRRRPKTEIALRDRPPVSPVPAVDRSGYRADPAGPRRSTLSAACASVGTCWGCGGSSDPALPSASLGSIMTRIRRMLCGCAPAARRPAPNGPGRRHSRQVSYSAAAAAATLVATSRIDESPVLRPDRAASRGLTSRRASKVVSWATGMTRSVASSAESS